MNPAWWWDGWFAGPNLFSSGSFSVDDVLFEITRSSEDGYQNLRTTSPVLVIALSEEPLANGGNHERESILNLVSNLWGDRILDLGILTNADRNRAALGQ